ncbi:SWIM zinc finger domain-containing protein [Actinotalea sp. C106]|uniref:SWIM zinc finger family protein n=1 Tax=Actinotalea sp. C106 TaxID=2908644 RepID=UPI002027BA88|nr:SWIM zinc finger family protein [Actinotalea sp. C106]
MLSPRALPDLADPATVSRGRAYARSGRVVAVRHEAGVLHAQVDGTDTYAVRLTSTSWTCTCPVGLTGALCKHCVAVVLAVAEGGPIPDAPDSGLAAQLPGQAVVLDVDEVADEVEATLAPGRRFYEYRHANGYAADAEGLVQLLEDAADSASLPLLRVLERAVTLMVRTILRSDDSSGVQGDQISRLLTAHARTAQGLPGTLDRKERRRLAAWLHRFRFSGTQDFFEVEVDAYGDVLGPDGVEHYRALVEESARAGAEPFAVQHARVRLAILEREPDAILAALGGEPTTQHQAIEAVAALDQAGLGRLAVQHAERGLRLPRTHRQGTLVDHLVRDAADRGDLEEAESLRHDHFRVEPSSSTFGALRAAAEATSTWEARRSAAEEHLAEHRSDQYLGVLLNEGRDDEAWSFATAHPEAAEAAQAWPRLCRRRAMTAPDETLPVYERMVTASLRTAGRRSYHHAAKLLVAMREAAQAAGAEHRYLEFAARTVEASRRRPACLEILRRHGVLGPEGAAPGSPVDEPRTAAPSR